MLAQVEVCNLTPNAGGIQIQAFHLRKLLESLNQLLDRDYAFQFLLDADRNHWTTFLASDVEMIFSMTDHSLGFLEARGDLVLDFWVVDAPKLSQVLDGLHLRITVKLRKCRKCSDALSWKIQRWRCLAPLGDIYVYIYDHGCYHYYCTSNIISRA